MRPNRFVNPAVFDLPLLFLKFGYIGAGECVFALCLSRIAAADGRGHIDLTEMAFVLGRSLNRCRQYLRHLHRIGIVEIARADGRGGAYFKLVVPPADRSAAPPRVGDTADA